MENQLTMVELSLSCFLAAKGGVKQSSRLTSKLASSLSTPLVRARGCLRKQCMDQIDRLCQWLAESYEICQFAVDAASWLPTVSIRVEDKQFRKRPVKRFLRELPVMHANVGPSAQVAGQGLFQPHTCRATVPSSRGSKGTTGNLVSDFH